SEQLDPRRAGQREEVQPLQALAASFEVRRECLEGWQQVRPCLVWRNNREDAARRTWPDRVVEMLDVPPPPNHLGHFGIARHPSRLECDDDLVLKLFGIEDHVHLARRLKGVV